MVQEIDIERLLEQRKAGTLTLIDVRSPSEYADSTIPGSLNIPLFDDEERAEVGTLYKQVSAEAAKERGLAIVSAKLPGFIKQFAVIPGRKAVFCWRGGMRSRTVATLLDLMDIRALKLQGGYREFRRWVVATLEQFEFKPQAVVINGYTGAGKTRLLQRLEIQGYPVLDLEGMAGHRGSVFGQVGLVPNNQKAFEAQLALKLLLLNEQPYVLMEAESQRIGKVYVPGFLMEAKAKGLHLFVDMPLSERVKRIVDEYEPHLHLEECKHAFAQIKKRIHTPVAAEIQGHLEENRFAEAVALLLAYYYDPRYGHAADQYRQERIVCRTGTMDEALHEVLERIGERFPSPRV